MVSSIYIATYLLFYLGFKYHSEQHPKVAVNSGGGVEWLLITLRIKFYLKTIDVINFAVG